MGVRRPLLFVTLCAVLAAAAIVAAARGTGGDAPGPIAPSGGSAAGSVSLTNETWVCDGPVELDSVTVTMKAAGRLGGDAVHLEDGCTGRIGLLTVTQSVADGVKVAEGAHDLTIGGGTIRCLGKIPNVHQDGIQVMGGARIRFENLTVSCGRPGESLINSNLFINQTGRSTAPPTDVVCVDCSFGGGAAHTVSIQDSVRSGAIGSTLCEAKYPKLTLTIGPEAVAPVDVRNTISDC